MWIVIIKERQLAPETDDGFVEEIVGVFDGFADEDSAIGWSGMFVDAADRDFRADVTETIHFSACSPPKRLFANYAATFRPVPPQTAETKTHMTVCSECLHRAPQEVTRPFKIVEGFPVVECELCNRSVDDVN